MSFVKKAIRRTKELFLNHPKIKYVIGYNGLLKFIFKKDIEMKTLEQLICLTHYNPKLREELELMVMNQLEMKLIAEQRLTTHIDMKKFSTYPTNSLGFQYYNFITRNQISLLNYPERYLRRCDLYTYIFLRILSTHDIYHVLLDADSSYFGEALVASFTIQQLPQYAPPCIHIGAGLIRYVMETNHQFDDALDILSKGMALGKEAKQLFCVNWDEHWYKNVTSLRDELNILIE